MRLIGRLALLRKVSLCCVLSLLVIASADAQTGALFMWKAASKSGQVVHILGSLHYAMGSSYPLANEIERAYAMASVIGVEVDTSKPQNADVAGLLTRYDGQGRLRKEVPQRVIKDVIVLARQHGWNMETIARTRPWAVAAMLTGADFEAHGYARSMGIDLHFIEAAKRDRKRLVELESIRDQFRVFNSLPRQTQVYMLSESIQSIRSGENVSTLDKLVSAWSHGDAVEFEQLTRASLADAPDPEALSAALYRTRNQKMAKRIAALALEEERTFIVVGAAHLAGPYSLLDALREQGFEIEQMSAANEVSIYP